MYDQFYGFSKKPFSISPDPSFIYLNSDYREALAMLQYGIEQRKGIVCLIGEVGTGKTMLLNKMLSSVDQQVNSILLSCPELSYRELIEFVQKQLGVEVSSKNVPEQVTVLYKYLLKERKQNRSVVLIIDEAQSLSVKMLEFLRLLSNLETSEEKLLQILLAGQPEFKTKLNLPEMRQFKQRIAVSFHLGPLKPEEIPVYIAHRLNISGCAMGLRLFSEEALTLIQEYSTGIPRLINAICENALLTGYVLSKRRIDGNIIEEAARDLMLEKPAAFDERQTESADTRIVPLKPEKPLAPESNYPRTARTGSFFRISAASAILAASLWFVVAVWPLLHEGLSKGWAEASPLKAVHGFLHQNLEKIKTYLPLGRGGGAGATAPEAGQKKTISLSSRPETNLPHESKGSLLPDGSVVEQHREPLVVEYVNKVPLPQELPGRYPNSIQSFASGNERPGHRAGSGTEKPFAAPSVSATPRKEETNEGIPVSAVPIKEETNEGIPVSATPRKEETKKEIPVSAAESVTAGPRSENSVSVTGIDTGDPEPTLSVVRKPNPKKFSSIRTIRSGDTFYGVSLETYGFVTPHIWGLVHLANPEIEDLNMILIDRDLHLPPLAPESMIFVNNTGQYRIYLNAAKDADRARELKIVFEQHAGIEVDIHFAQITSDLGFYLLQTGRFATRREALDELRKLLKIPLISKIMEARDEPDIRSAIKG